MRLAGFILACLALASSGRAQTPGRIGLRCTPSTVTKAGALSLHFEAARGRELGVRTPDGRFLFIAFAQEVPALASPVPPSALLLSTPLQLHVGQLVGAQSMGRGQLERVFTVPGRYRFVVSENLETEDDRGVNGSCVVRLLR